MDFYGRNDISLGAFLEKFCFSTTYRCPQKECNVAAVGHVRKFVHESGCIEIILRHIDPCLDMSDSTSILMWSWCKHCRKVSAIKKFYEETCKSKWHNYSII